MFFGGELFDKSILIKEIYIFIAFCLSSSVVYIINDVKDLENDRNHPLKKERPIAKGDISIKSALFAAFISLALSLTIIYYLKSINLLICILSYIILNIIYTFYAKRIGIIDVIFLAMGFVIRVLAGSIPTTNELSQWLLIMVFLLSIFLALGKRWNDVSLIEENQTTGEIRKSIGQYSKELLLSLLTFLAAVNTICYIVYSVTGNTHDALFNKYFFTTSLWVILGNMRYLQIIFVFNNSYSPTQALFHDKIIRIAVLLWILHISFFLYFKF
jgi:4-hydroxybenzoate polyprenyltransferase